jgi:hypothetical protein
LIIGKYRIKVQGLRFKVQDLEAEGQKVERNNAEGSKLKGDE